MDPTSDFSGLSDASSRLASSLASLIWERLLADSRWSRGWVVVRCDLESGVSYESLWVKEG